MNFICTWVGGGGTRWALTWENLWGHGCNIQFWSSENPEWIEGEGGVWATCPWAWPLLGKGWPRRTGQGECGELPSKSSVQRVHSTQTYSRLMSVSRMVHWCMGYNNMSVFLLPMLPGLWWHWYSFGLSPCVEEEVAMAGGVDVGLRSKGGLSGPGDWQYPGREFGLQPSDLGPGVGPIPASALKWARPSLAGSWTEPLWAWRQGQEGQVGYSSICVYI